MNIIEKIRFLWKTWRRTLSIDEFSTLLNLSGTTYFAKQSSDNKTARWLLGIYFKASLRPEEQKLLTSSLYSKAQDQWLKIAKHRNLTDEEQYMLVHQMPWNFLRRFPKKLSDTYVEALFDDRNPLKIVAYCRSFALPEKFEKFLIENYQKSLKTIDEKMQYQKYGNRTINGWAEALIAYLEGPDFRDKRLTAKDVQIQLLHLNDDKIVEKLILRCSIIENILHEDIIWELIDKNKADALRLLLRESYLAGSPSQINHFEAKMPQLKAQMLIAKLRREQYLLEQEKHVFIGALVFKPREDFLIQKHHLYQSEDQNNLDEFVKLYIQPQINTFGSCMCAYIAYHFPQLANDALKHLQEVKSYQKRTDA